MKAWCNTCRAYLVNGFCPTPDCPSNKPADPQPEPTAESADTAAEIIHDLAGYWREAGISSGSSAAEHRIKALIATAKAEGRREALESLLNERRYVQYQDGAKGYGIAVPAAKLYDQLAELKGADDEA
jgi:hypothetical protein